MKLRIEITFTGNEPAMNLDVTGVNLGHSVEWISLQPTVGGELLLQKRLVKSIYAVTISEDTDKENTDELQG